MDKKFTINRIFSIFLLFACIYNHSAFAQEDVESQLERINPTDTEIYELKDEFELKPLPPPPLLMPETTPLEDKTNISSGIRVYVKRLKIIGNTAFSNEELSNITSHYENREITFEELQAVRQELTLLYIDRGYISSGVIIPDQQVVDGIIILKVIEGRLSNINIEGNKYFRSSYIRDRLELSSKPPLNIHVLQQALQILQQDTRIKRINAELGPGIMPGEAVLKVKVEEEDPYNVTLNFSNNQSPSVGSNRGELSLAHKNLFGIGHMLEAEFGLTEGTEDYNFSYSIPVTARDTTVAVHYQESESTVIEEEFEKLDIESKTESYGLTISHPLYKTLDQEFSLALTGEIRRNATFLLGRPFSFTDIADNVSHVTVMRFTQEWINRSNVHILALRSNFSLGIDAFNATISDNVTDGEFFSWIGQVLWLRQWTDDEIQTVFHTDIQLANDSLLPMEKFPVGGMNSVRGYRENQLVRDNGVVSSFELRLPVIRNRQRKVIVQFAPFADFGWSWNARGETPEPKSISSIGAGIRWRIRENIHFNIYAGYPLREIENLDHDLQDEGIHFQLNWQMF